jgi:CRP-like cAMP-binding protein/sugar phosphate permease
MLIATAAPSLVIGLLAGVFVDRYDRKKIMVAADLIQAALVFTIPFVLQFGLVWLYILVALQASVSQFFNPAHESVLPETASEDELAAANALMAISSFGSTAIGFAAAGLIAAAADIRWAFWLDALTFLFSAVCIGLTRIKSIPPEGDASVALVLKNLRSGVNHLWRTPILRSLLLVSIPVFIAFGAHNTLLLPFASRALGANEFQYGIQEALTSVGFVVGSLLLASLFDRLREGPWLAFSFLGMGLAGIAYSFTRSIPVAIAIVTLDGFMNAPGSIGRRVIIQRNTPRELRGRVSSAFFVSRDLLFVAGMALAGFADVINVRVLFFLISLLLVGAGAWVLVLPGLRQQRAAWAQSLQVLRGAAAAPGLGVGHPAALSDFDLLVGLLPSLSALTPREREGFLSAARVVDAPPGTAVVRKGEKGDNAYFIMVGRAIAGTPLESGGYRSLNTLQAGDFFGEIAALTGSPRTANVVTEEPSRLMQVPGSTLRSLMANPAMNQLLLHTMSSRLEQLRLSDLPRLAGYDQAALRELRTAPAVE